VRSLRVSAFDVSPRIVEVLLGRSARVWLLVCAVGVGALLAIAARGFLDTSLIVTVLAVPLVIPVAIAKSATACGMNALASFSRYSRPPAERLTAAVAYAVTATATAAGVGFVVSTVGNALGLSRFFALGAPICLYLGMRELGAVGHGPPVSSLWQVPSRWVRDSRSSPFVWGFFLGSGISTQMPYPSYYALLTVVAMLEMPLGIALMAMYGAGRSLPALAAAVDGRFAGTPDVAVLLKFRLAGHASAGIACVALSGVFAALFILPNQAP
jgi:hypothetical protein